MARIDLYNPQPFPKEIHRWGWNGVSKLILEHFHDENADIMLDSMIEHTFKAGRHKKMDFCRFPHMNQKWISIFHSPCTSLGPTASGWEQNISTLYANKHYRAFMENCIGMITLSKNYALKTKVAFKGLDIDTPIGFVHHPSAECNVKFKMQNFRRQVIHTGFWLRNFDSFYRLKTKYKKILLQGPGSYGEDEYYLSKIDLQTRHLQNCTHLRNSYLPNDEYDKIMSESVVFLDLYDAVANNTVVECISRQTPLLINPLDSVVEYLGKDYPFYYYSLDEAAEKLENDDLVEKTSFYLKDRQQMVCPNKFVSDLNKILDKWVK